jgi:hypothetical protein
LSVRSGETTSRGTIWSLGPLTVSFPLFDGGSTRRRHHAAARAAYDEAVALYRAQMRRAVREVEQNLVTLQSSTLRQADAERALRWTLKAPCVPPRRASKAAWPACWTWKPRAATPWRRKVRSSNCSVNVPVPGSAWCVRWAGAGTRRRRPDAPLQPTRQPLRQTSTLHCCRTPRSPRNPDRPQAICTMNLPFLRKPLWPGRWPAPCCWLPAPPPSPPRPPTTRPRPAPAKAALTVTTVQAQRADLARAVQANGSLAAWQEAIVGAEANGLRLAEVRVNVGDVVKRGQVLATFAADMPQADLAQSKASVAEAEATLAEAGANAQRARDLQASGALSAQQINQYLTAERTAQARLEAVRAAGPCAAAAPGADPGAGARRGRDLRAQRHRGRGGAGGHGTVPPHPPEPAGMARRGGGQRTGADPARPGRACHAGRWCACWPARCAWWRPRWTPPRATAWSTWTCRWWARPHRAVHAPACLRAVNLPSAAAAH